MEKDYKILLIPDTEWYYDYHGTIISPPSGANRISSIDEETGRDPQIIPPISQRNFRIIEGLDD